MLVLQKEYTVKWIIRSWSSMLNKLRREITKIIR